MEKESERPFITYANLSLSEDVKNLKKLVEKHPTLFEKFNKNRERINAIIDLMAIYSDTDSQSANIIRHAIDTLQYYFSIEPSEREEFKKTSSGCQIVEHAEALIKAKFNQDPSTNFISRDDDGKYIDDAFSYVYGRFNDSPCYLIDYKQRLSAIGKRECSKSSLKCYLCDHAYIQSVIEKIISGKNFSDIEGFDELVLSAKMIISFTSPYKAEIDNVLITEEMEEEYYSEQISFATLFRGIIADDLLKYLSYGDRRKLKQCSQCQKFHIRKTVKQEARYFCSDKCKNAFKNANKTPDQNRAAVKRSRALDRKDKKLDQFKRDIKRMAEAGNNDKEIRGEMRPRIDKEIEYLIEKGFTRYRAENYYNEVCKHPKMCKP